MRLLLPIWNMFLCLYVFSPLFFFSPNYMHVQEATELLTDGIDLIPDADMALSNLLSYPLHSTLNRYYTLKKVLVLLICYPKCVHI